MAVCHAICYIQRWQKGSLLIVVALCDCPADPQNSDQLLLLLLLLLLFFLAATAATKTHVSASTHNTQYMVHLRSRIER